MANRFYATDENRADRVRDLFDAIAPRYDLINDLQSFGMHRYWKRRLVQMTELREGERALDLCCGTGDVAFALAASGGLVTGVDFSLSMLLVARKRARQLTGEFARDRAASSSLILPSLPSDGGEGRGEEVRPYGSPLSSVLSPLVPRKERKLSLMQPRRSEESAKTRTPGHDAERFGPKAASRGMAAVEFLRGDAMRLPFLDEQIDVVTISYGLRNLENFEASLTEMRRVLKPGGRLLVLDFGKPDNAAWRKMYFTYLRWFVPWFGRLFCGDPETHAYILESLLHYPGQRGIADLMDKQRFSAIRVVNLLGGIMSINYGRKGEG